MLSAFGQSVDLSCERACPSVRTNYTCTVTGFTKPILEWAIIKLDDMTTATDIFNARSGVNVPVPVHQYPTWPFTLYLTEVSEGNTSTNLTSVVEFTDTPDAGKYKLECFCDTCSTTGIQSCNVLLEGNNTLQHAYELRDTCSWKKIIVC